MTATQERTAAIYTRVGTTKQNAGIAQRPSARLTVAYVRVSTEDQAKEGNSLADQERQTRAYAIARDWGEVADVYADPGVSGATRDRPALTRLLADAKAGKIGRVIITKIDRMSRKAADLLAIEEDLDQCDVERIYIKDSIDTSNPTGRLLRTVLAAVAELERDMILERTRAGKIEDVRNGAVWLTGRTIGYRYIPADKQSGRRAGVEIDEETAPLVHRIFTDVAHGISMNALARQLNAEGVPTMRGASMWRVCTLGKIIYNPLFTGQAAYGRMRNVKTAHGTMTTRPADPAHVEYAAVPALVSPELAQAAQAMLARNRIKATRNAKRDYLLGGGLMHCGVLLDDGQVCGSTMRGDAHHRGIQYRCSHVAPSGRNRHSVPGLLMEETVRTALRTLIENPDTVLAEVEALSQDGAKRAATAVADIERFTRAARDVEARQSRLLDLYLAGNLDQATYTDKAAELAATQTTIATQQVEAIARRDAGAMHEAPVADTRVLCEQIASRLDTLTPAQWRHLTHILCTRITASHEEVTIEGAFELTPFKEDEGIVATAIRHGSHRAAVPRTGSGRRRRSSPSPSPSASPRAPSWAASRRGTCRPDRARPSRRPRRARPRRSHSRCMMPGKRGASMSPFALLALSDTCVTPPPAPPPAGSPVRRGRCAGRAGPPRDCRNEPARPRRAGRRT